MLALTPTLEPNQGGFECVPGFHREFEHYYANSAIHDSTTSQTTSRRDPPVCVGDFSPIQSKEDSKHIR